VAQSNVPFFNFGGDLMNAKGLMPTAVAATLLLVCDSASAVLIAHYPFDDGSGTTATDLVAGNNATIKNWNTGVTTGNWVAGRFGGAYNFNGTDSADTPLTALAALQVNHNATVAYWKKGNNLPNDSTYPYAEDFQVSGMNLHSWAAWNPFVAGGTVYQSVNAGSGFSDQIGAPAPDTLNDWHHYALVKDRAAGTVKLYIDGALSATNAAATKNFDPPGKFDIGSSIFGGASLRGAIDDFRIYDVPLTLAEIQALVPEPATLAPFCLACLIFLRDKRRGNAI